MSDEYENIKKVALNVLILLARYAYQSPSDQLPFEDGYVVIEMRIDVLISVVWGVAIDTYCRFFHTNLVQCSFDIPKAADRILKIKSAIVEI